MQLLDDVDVAALRRYVFLIFRYFIWNSCTQTTSFLNDYHHLVGQETDEYDFRDFRWAKLERLRRTPWIAADAAYDEALLEDKSSGVDTAVTQDDYDSRVPCPSPVLDAMYIENNPLSYASNTRWPVENPSIDATTTDGAPSNMPLGADENQYGEFPAQGSEFWGTFIPGDLFWPLDEFQNW